MPAGCAYVWIWFLELHEARGGTGYGPLPIGYGDIYAWARLTGRRLAPWEVFALRALDRVWLTKPDLGGVA